MKNEITKWFGVEENFKYHPLQPPDHGRDIFYYNSSNLTEHCQYGASLPGHWSRSCSLGWLCVA